VILINSTNIRIENLVLSNNVQNVFLIATNDTTIANCSITNSVYGIAISSYSWYDFALALFFRFDSYNTTIEDNTLIENGVGMTIRSDKSTVKNNTLDKDPLGICLPGTSNSTISQNVVSGSNTSAISPSYGPELSVFYYPFWPWEYSREIAQLEIGGVIVGGEDNAIYGNTVKDCNVGIQMYEPIGSYFGVHNTVFHNNFVDNKPYQALFPPRGGNDFDDGYPSGGNYWSDYTGPDLYSGSHQNETGSDGIRDASYFINHDNIDRYPLSGMFYSFNVSWVDSGYFVDLISNSTISGFDVGVWIEHPEDPNTRIIGFNVTGANDTIGFCRILIPTALMNGTYTVFVNGLEVASNLLPGSTSTHSYLYFNYAHSTQEVTIILEFPSFTILPLFFMATLLAVITYRRRHH
jgi:parallel beta-helix repeat protein